MPADLIVLVRDLLFASRIREAAWDAGVDILTLRDASDLPDRPGRRLFVDLNQPGAIEAAGQWRRATGGQTIGFVSHVDSETIARARDAGIDRILSRGQFTQLLPELIREGFNS
jgi:hypothetical protein